MSQVLAFLFYSDRLSAYLVLLVHQEKGQRGSGPKHLENHPSRSVFLTPLGLLTKEMGGYVWLKCCC